MTLRFARIKMVAVQRPLEPLSLPFNESYLVVISVYVTCTAECSTATDLCSSSE